MDFFTADSHFNHKKLPLFPTRLKFTCDSWEDYMIEKINKKVSSKDRLYVLGDFVVGKIGDLFRIRKKIVCNDIWIIRGNHDLSMGQLRSLFCHVHDTLEIKIKEIPCFLSHYPHMAWPKSHYGSFHLHGHMHDQRSLYWDEIWPDRRMLDVSPEAKLRIHREMDIWSEDEIYDFMMKRNGHDDVEWYVKNAGIFA